MTIASGSESYILCELAGATYAVRSDDIEQLDMVGQVTPVPNAPAFVDGITSLRGRVIPVVNMRARFGFERAPIDLRSRLIVVRVGPRSVGLVVDSAREFARIPADSIQAPPDGLAELSSQYLRGMAHLGDRLVLVLDMIELLNITETPSTSSTAIVPALA
ncbi:MAG TPA: chemotaxis protein CheW [Gemmatimonadaceae bacterium]|nr:chemotaxis protein CheW [Gemmatimonadaceae bacterium]